MYDYRTLGDLLGTKGYIRGPFGSTLVRKELQETGVYAVYEQAQAISGSRSFRYFINQEKFEELRRFRVQPGDLLISCSGTVGRVSIVMEDDPDGIISQALLILRPQTGEIIPEYLRWFLSTREGKNALTNASHGSVQVNIAPRATVESIEIPTPDLRTQEAIAHILGTIDDKIELNQKMNQTLEEIAKAIFKSWFVDFDPVRAKAEGRPTGLPPEISDLFPDELVDSEIGEIPKNWRLTDLKSLAKISGGKQLDRDKFDEAGDVPVYGANGIMGWTNKSNVSNFVIIFGRVGANCGSVHWEYSPTWIGNNASFIAPLDHNEFVLQTLLMTNFEGLRSGSAQPFISNTALGSTRCLVPSDAAADRFCQIIRGVRLRQDSISKENRLLAELRDTLLPKLISGELRIPDAEKFLEEAGI
jgi:type I restriction enzyme S subunit